MLKLDHLQFAMPEGEEAKALWFFTDLLGLPEIDKPEALKARGGCWFQLGELELHLGAEADFRPAQKAHPAFRVSDYEALQQRLAKAGFPLIPDYALTGVERFYSHDPFGNRIEFIKEEPCS